MNIEAQRRKTHGALEILGKWRTLFAGWQLGTRTKADPEAAAVQNLQEARLLMRAELTAVVALLMDKGVISEADWLLTLERAAKDLSQALERKFEGVTAHDYGLNLDPVKIQAAGWMGDWKP